MRAGRFEFGEWGEGSLTVFGYGERRLEIVPTPRRPRFIRYVRYFHGGYDITAWLLFTRWMLRWSVRRKV